MGGGVPVGAQGIENEPTRAPKREYGYFKVFPMLPRRPVEGLVVELVLLVAVVLAEEEGKRESVDPRRSTTKSTLIGSRISPKEECLIINFFFF